MNPNPPLPSRAWLIVALLWVVAFLNYLDRLMITTMRGSLTEAIPMTDAQFGLLTSVFLWVYAACSPFAGFLADRVSRSRVIIGSLLVWSVVTWLTGHAKTFEQLLAARALMGISEAAYIPAALALITDYHRGTTRSLATGVHLTGIGVGSGLGGMGGWLAERHGWSYAFYLFGLIGIGYAVLLLLTLRDAPPAQSGDGEPAPTRPKASMTEALTSLFSRRSYYLMLAYWGLFGVAGWAIIGWMPTYLTEHFRLSQGVAGLSATGYLQAAGLLGLVIGGAWADRWSRTHPRARILVPVIGLSVAAPGILLASMTDTLGIAIVGLIVFGLARAFADANTMPMLCMVADERYRATGFGVMNLVACVVGGLTIYAGGALRDAKVDVSHVFQFGAASLVLCAVLIFFLRSDSAPAADAGK